MSKLHKGDVVLVHNKTGDAWTSEDGAFVLRWLPTMSRYHGSYYVVERALRLTGSGARTSLVECEDGEDGEFALLKKTRDAATLVRDETTGIPYVFPASWLRVTMKAQVAQAIVKEQEYVQEAAKPEVKPAQQEAPAMRMGVGYGSEHVGLGITAANYTPKHPIYKWTGPVPWDPEGE